MLNYPFDFNTLFSFSNSLPYLGLKDSHRHLFNDLNNYQTTLNFPAVQNDVGELLSFLCGLVRPKIIFEMGSGYGHSCFWYMVGGHEFIEKVVLTEKRDDLESIFYKISWDTDFKSKIEYHQGDAFEKLQQIKDIDLLLIDGVKGDYLKFLEESFDKLNENALIVIDNSFWRGSFLDEEYAEKKSAKNIKELHEYISSSNKFAAVFLPFKDGVTLLRKKSLS